MHGNNRYGSKNNSTRRHLRIFELHLSVGCTTLITQCPIGSSRLRIDFAKHHRDVRLKEVFSTNDLHTTMSKGYR